MPSTPYAKILVSVNAGANTSGGVDIPSAATVQLSAESTVGWLRARWEIFDYPEGWATPAGWSLDASGVIYSTSFTPPSITMPDAGALWGVWMLRLKVNGQIDTSDVLENLVDETSALCMLSPSGLRDIGAREGTQFTTVSTAVKKWVRSWQRNLRALENPKIPLTTTDATATHVRRYPMADGSVRCIRAIIKVQSSNGSGAVRGEWEVKGAWARVAGTLSQAYAPTITQVFLVGSPGAPSFALNGNTDVDLKVTGIAATSLDWSVSEFTLY